MKIKSIQLCVILFFVTCSCQLGFITNTSTKLLQQNGWIVPILGSIFGFLIFLIYLYIFNYKKNMNINDLNIHLFGNVVGKIFNTVLIITFSIFVTIIFLVLTNFISSQYLYNTPPIIVEIAFFLTIIYILNHGLNSLSRTFLCLMYIMIILFIVNFIGLIRQTEIKNIMPFLDFKFSNLIKAILTYISLAILPTLSLLIIPKNNIENDKLNKKIIITYIITHLCITLILFIIISILGIKLIDLYEFPGYHILKRVFEGGIIERFENILAFYWLIVSFTSVIFVSYYITKSIEQNFKLKKSKYIILFVILHSSRFFLTNSTSAKIWIEKFFPSILYIGLLIIPIIIFIKIKKRSIN